LSGLQLYYSNFSCLGPLKGKSFITTVDFYFYFLFFFTENYHVYLSLYSKR